MLTVWVSEVFVGGVRRRLLANLVGVGTIGQSRRKGNSARQTGLTTTLSLEAQ